MCHVQVRKLQQITQITSGCTVAAHHTFTISVLTENYQKGMEYPLVI